MFLLRRQNAMKLDEECVEQEDEEDFETPLSSDMHDIDELGFLVKSRRKRGCMKVQRSDSDGSKSPSSKIQKTTVVSFEGDGKTRVHQVRMVEATLHPFQVRTAKSVLSLAVGQNTGIESFIFTIAAKKKSGVIMMWLLWVIGAISGLLTLAKLLTAKFIWISLFMLPLPILTFCVLSSDMVSRVTQEFEFKVLSFFLTMFFVALWKLLADKRRLFIACCAPSFFLSLFIDAFPAKYSQIFSVLFFLGTGSILVTWDLIILFGCHEPLRNVKLKLGEVVIGAKPFSFSTSISLLLFIYRHLKVAIFNPNILVLCKSTLKTRYSQFSVSQTEKGVSVERKRTSYHPVRVEFHDDVAGDITASLDRGISGQFSGGRLSVLGGLRHSLHNLAARFSLTNDDPLTPTPSSSPHDSVEPSPVSSPMSSPRDPADDRGSYAQLYEDSPFRLSRLSEQSQASEEDQDTRRKLLQRQATGFVRKEATSTSDEDSNYGLGSSQVSREEAAGLLGETWA